MLSKIISILNQRNEEVQSWLQSQWKELTPSLTLSCDIRHSGHKIAVIDANIYPAGFNNLCNNFTKKTSEAFLCFFNEYYPHVKKILIFGEDHTRNKFYLKNLLKLQKLLVQSGFEVEVGMLGSDWQDKTKLEVTLEEGLLVVRKVVKNSNRASVDGFEPDFILSNNDFSSGIPDVLENISQPVVPSPQLGWHRRTKSRHFDIVEQIATDFGNAFKIDPWFLSPLHRVVSAVDFSEEESLKILAQEVDGVIESIRKKYSEYGIEESPYVYVKNNSGTYGMGILPVFSGEEVLNLNRKKKNKLQSSKGNVLPTQYLIQEGIPTADSYSEYPIEPVIYVVGKKDVGGFFRIHESKNQLESLNAPGMTFSCLCLHKIDEPHETLFIDCQSKKTVVTLSRFVAQLSAIAAGCELKNS